MRALVAGIALVGSGFAQRLVGQVPSARDPSPTSLAASALLVGTWRVVGHEIRDSTGRLVSSDRGRRIGYVTFDASGYYTNVTMDRQRRVPTYRGRLTPEDGRDAYETFGANFGTYSADRGDTLTYRLEGALYPGNVPGTIVLRRFRIKGDTLIIDPLGEEPGRPMFTRVHVRITAAPTPVESGRDASMAAGVAACTLGDPARLLERLERERGAILLRGDVSALDGLLDATFVEQSASGEVRTKADNLNAARKGVLRFSAVEITDVHASACGESGMVTGRMHRVGTMEGKPFDGTIRYTRLFTRRAGAWKAVFQIGAPVDSGAGSIR